MDGSALKFSFRPIGGEKENERTLSSFLPFLLLHSCSPCTLLCARLAHCLWLGDNYSSLVICRLSKCYTHLCDICTYPCDITPSCSSLTSIKGQDLDRGWVWTGVIKGQWLLQLLLCSVSAASLPWREQTGQKQLPKEPGKVSPLFLTSVTILFFPLFTGLCIPAFWMLGKALGWWACQWEGNPWGLASKKCLW